MNHSFEKKSGSIIHLKVEFSADEFKAYWDNAFADAAAAVHLKGFRPGQAPKEFAAKAVDTEKVFDAAANSAVRNSLNDIIAEHEWTVIDAPKIAVDTTEKLDFIYTADLIIFPEVVLGDYKKIARKIFSDGEQQKKTITVTPEEIEKSFEFLKKSGADLHNFKDETAIRQSIADGLRLEKEGREREKAHLIVLDAIVKQATMDIPEVMITRTVAQGLSAEAARTSVAQHLVVYTIAKLEQLDPTPEEVGAEVQRFGQRGEKVDSRQAYDYIYGVLQNQKVFDFLEKQTK